jgi:hypothetical protein
MIAGLAGRASQKTRLGVLWWRSYPIGAARLPGVCPVEGAASDRYQFGAPHVRFTGQGEFSLCDTGGWTLPEVQQLFEKLPSDDVPEQDRLQPLEHTVRATVIGLSPASVRDGDEPTTWGEIAERSVHSRACVTSTPSEKSEANCRKECL